MGFAGPEKLWSERGKESVLELSRNLLPDGSLAWLDAAVALGTEGASYARLLGSGGNFGSQDLSVGYVKHAIGILDSSLPKSSAWLAAALTGTEATPYLRDAVGQGDPGRAGGKQSSPFESGDKDGFLNPWAFILMIEGTLFFTSSVGRRRGSETARVAVPFQVSGTTGSFAGAALDEKVAAEIWTPTWSRSASIDEVRQLMRDGRAEWGNRPARSGLDFALAVRSLGTDRGIDRFTRHVVVNRLGQSPLAVAVDAVEVPEADRTSGLGPIDAWLGGVRRIPHVPRSIAVALQAAEGALMRVSRDDKPDTRTELVRRLGHLHRLVGRSGAARGRVWPLVLSDPADWVDREGGVEMRLAVALASAHDGTAGGRLGIVRAGVGLVTIDHGQVRWSSRPSPIDSDATLDRTLADIHVRRATDLASRRDPVTDGASAIRGISTGPVDGWWAHPSDLAALCWGDVDLHTLRELLDGYVLFDWAHVRSKGFAREGRAVPVPAVLSILLPFASRDALPLAVSAETGAVHDVVLRVSPRWPALLRAGRVGDVVTDAVQRLRAGGVPDVPSARSFGGGPVDGLTLSAALLVNVSRAHRIAAVGRVASLPPSAPKPTD